ncbi:methylenetetrahydrofolate reductase [NAD(P)H] [Ketogulonicigenium vulgare]|uniref:methylenetetrahydrofolate reductase [NAD(P)H] n=1 Tax=Ketogulonicigenium vulgare TaxID=92945 RepID=UPI0023590005|nr:methylenetetrahydrofolate reductase [NAD(P)H] [Ketogulonicigenium vulgare]
MSAPIISFEFFPPRNLEAAFRLWDTVKALAPLRPAFVSVTYGAGGTTRQLTQEAVVAIHKATGLNVAAHLTCVNATRDETLAIADDYAAAGVTQIVALRGDPPKGAGKFTPQPDGFQNSVELIAALAATGKFKLRVGAYPERHPDAANTAQDVEWLKRKFDAGADSALTQFFFDTTAYFRFLDLCEKAGVTGKIIPGILPVENWKGARRFAESCGAHIPPAVIAAFEAAPDDANAVAIDLATQMSQQLMQAGADHLHYYTLNKPDLSLAIAANLGIRP